MKHSECKVAEVVRVSRGIDDNKFIVKTENQYLLIDGESQTSHSTLSSALSVGSWRKPTTSEKRKTEIMADKFMAPKKSEKTFRVPPAVQKSVGDALNSGMFSNPIDLKNAAELASGSPVTQKTVEWVKNYFKEVETSEKLYGGNAGKTWASKFSANVLVAAAFTPSEEYTYYAVGEDESAPENVKQLLGVDSGDSLFSWVDGDWFALPDTLEEYDMPNILEISDEDAKALADWIDDPEKDQDFFVITDIDPDERNLVSLAYSEIDWEEIDRLESLTADAAGYTPIERSNNAQRQIRANDGKFGGPQIEIGTEHTSLAKARLPENLPLVTDPAKRIEEYLGGEMPAEDPVVAAGEAEKPPLYFAVVDPVDNTAVLDVISIVPDEAGNATAWKRSNAEWVASPESLDDLRGATPLPVVELSSEELAKNVLSQVDAYDSETQDNEEISDESTITASAYELADYSKEQREKDAKKGLALPDGSYPIRTVSDLKNAIKAFGRAPEKKRAEVKRHIKKRAKALNRSNLVPEDWKETSIFDDDHLSPLYGEFGEVIAMTAAGGNAETLRQYWSVGKGALKIRWGTDGDLTRCHRQLNKYMPGRAWGYCQNLHKRIFGVTNAEKDKAEGL